MSNTNRIDQIRRFLGELVAASPRKVLLSGIVMVALGFTEGVGLLMLVPLLQLVGIDASGGTLGRISQGLADVLGWVGAQPTLGLVLVVYLLIVSLQGLLTWWQAVLSAEVQFGLVGALRTRVYSAIANTEWTYFVGRRASTFSHVLTDEVDRVGSASFFVVDLVVTSIISAIYIGLAFRVSPSMTLVVLACGGVLAWTMRGRLNEARRSGERYSHVRDSLYAAISEHFGGMKTAKSYNTGARHAAVFSGLSAELLDVNVRSTADYTKFRQQSAVGSAVVLAAIVYVSRQWLLVPTAQLVLLLFLFARLMPRLSTVLDRVRSIVAQLPSYDAVAKLEAECLAAAESVSSNPEPITLDRTIQFDHVTFAYGERTASPAVNDVSLTLEVGRMIAFVGPSGSGKSTLADILIGLLTPQSGRLLVDGAPLDAGRRRAWRDLIGYVPQDTFLFHDSVRANLQWARPGATDDDLWRALRMAAAESFVEALPLGLDTVLGDRGVLLSGGERQRLSLARALLRKPSLLVLDEATSALDSENEAQIQDAIDALHEQMTIVIITHRLSTIRAADVIHVVERGEVVESGTWTSLQLREGGRFRQLLAAQGMSEMPAHIERTRPASARALGA